MMASVMAMKLSVMEKVIFSLMVVIIRFEDDGNAAEDDGDPRHVERKRIPLQQAADDGNTGDHEEGDVLFDAAQLQQLLQLFHEMFHIKSLFYTSGGMRIIYPRGYIVSKKKQPRTGCPNKKTLLGLKETV